MHRSVDIFNIHAKIMDDYKHFVSSFINIKNEWVREGVEGEIDTGKSMRMSASGRCWPENASRWSNRFC